MGHHMNDDSDLLDLIEINRAVYAALCKAEDDFNSSDESNPEDGDLEMAMNRAVEIHQRTFSELLIARPRTPEEMAAMIVYVNEVAKQQIEKGHHDDGPAILAANLKEVVRLAP
jgi:hypothetical protein